MKNKKNIMLGFVFGLVTTLILGEILQVIFAYLFGAPEANIGFWFVFPVSEIILGPGFSTFSTIIIYLFPVFFALFLIEIGKVFLYRTVIGNLRFAVLFFIFAVLGYLILYSMYGALMIILQPPYQNDWINIAKYFELEGVAKFVAAFFIIIFILSYLQLTSRKIMEFIKV